MTRLGVLALLAACGPAAVPPARPGDAAREMGLLRRVEASACPARPLWCAAARAWEGARPVALAEGEHVAVGITVALQEGKDVGPALEDASVSVLAWRRRGDRVLGRIVELVPASDEEKLETTEAGHRVTELLLGRAEIAPIPAALAHDLPAFASQARYPLQADGPGWLLHGTARAELRRVGDTWVVIEVPPTGPRGVFFSVFTERWVAGDK